MADVVPLRAGCNRLDVTSRWAGLGGGKVLAAGAAALCLPWLVVTGRGVGVLAGWGWLGLELGGGLGVGWGWRGGGLRGEGRGAGHRRGAGRSGDNQKMRLSTPGKNMKLKKETS